MRGVYVIQDWKPNRPFIHKVGMSESIGHRKGDYASHVFEPEFSRIYEIHEGFDLHKIETAFHNTLELMGVKVGTEWFDVEVEQIDECAIDLFNNKFKGALKEFHMKDTIEIERENSDSQSKSSSTNKNININIGQYSPHLIGFQPRDDQLELLDKLKKHLIENGNTRGQIRLPPGYGKTQIGCCLFPIEQKMKRILILVPSIKLAKETAKRVMNFHKTNLNINCFKYYEVHSEGGTFDIVEMNTQEYVCVIGVYNSVAKLHDAREFDITIFDEAHRTSIKTRGNDENDNDVNETHFTYALYNENIQSKFRLFMTATPRIIVNDENSMSNIEKYGDVIYSMTIREAVKKHIINDYKIWLYVKEQNEQLSIETDGERFALLLKFLENSKGNKTLIVCRSIKGCNFVASKLKVHHFENVYSVHSQMNKNDVDRDINLFKSTEDKSCLCAVNMFKEGIDCPAIDSVVFYDERSSVIDVLQIVGRGLRYKPHLQFTDIGILCSINPNERLEEQSEMRYLRMIIQNMLDSNEELTNNLQVFKEDSNRRGHVDTMIYQIRNEMKDNEDTRNFDIALTVHSGVADYGERHFIQARSYAQERSALFGWRLTSDWFDYINRVDLPKDVPRRPDRIYKNMGWISWDDFLGLDSEKPLDFGTYKYILQNNMGTNNPSTDEYQAIVQKYGGKKMVSPSECTKIYGKSFYNILGTIFGNTDFMSLNEFRKLIAKYSKNGRFGIVEYEKMKDSYSNLPHFPLVYYNVSSFSRI